MGIKQYSQPAAQVLTLVLFIGLNQVVDTRASLYNSRLRVFDI